MSSTAELAPEPAYRWIIVTATALMLAISMGMMVNGISSFIIPLNNEFGWSRGDITLINMSGLIGTAFGGIVMGRLADRTSTRRVCMIGVTVLGLCLLGAGRANELWQFYVLFTVAGFLGAGALFAPLIANLGPWFKSSIGLAIGIASAGQALGQGGVPFATAYFISNMGWRESMTTMGIITLVVMLPLVLLIRKVPSEGAANTADGPAADEKSPVPLSTNTVVVWLGMAVVFCCICMSVPLIHLVPLIHDRGFPLEDAGSVIFLMLVAAIFGRVAFGKIADMIGALNAYWVSSCWQTVLMLGFLQIETLQSFYIFVVIYGFGYAGVMTSLLVSASVLTPVSKRGFALGFVTFFGWLGHAIGGYQGGVFFDMFGNYTMTYVNAAIAGVINLIIVGSLIVTISRRKKAAMAFAG